MPLKFLDIGNGEIAEHVSLDSAHLHRFRMFHPSLPHFLSEFPQPLRFKSRANMWGSQSWLRAGFQAGLSLRLKKAGLKAGSQPRLAAPPKPLMVGHAHGCACSWLDMLMAEPAHGWTSPLFSKASRKRILARWTSTRR